MQDEILDVLNETSAMLSRVSEKPLDSVLKVSNGSSSDTSSGDEELKALKKQVALLEKIISVCIPDENLIRKMKEAAVWNDEKKEYTIPVHYVCSCIFIFPLTTFTKESTKMLGRLQRCFPMCRLLMSWMFVELMGSAMRKVTG